MARGDTYVNAIRRHVLPPPLREASTATDKAMNHALQFRRVLASKIVDETLPFSPSSEPSKDALDLNSSANAAAPEVMQRHGSLDSLGEHIDTQMWAQIYEKIIRTTLDGTTTIANAQIASTRDAHAIRALNAQRSALASERPLLLHTRAMAYNPSAHVSLDHGGVVLVVIPLGARIDARDENELAHLVVEQRRLEVFLENSS